MLTTAMRHEVPPHDPRIERLRMPAIPRSRCRIRHVRRPPAGAAAAAG